MTPELVHRFAKTRTRHPSVLLQPGDSLQHHMTEVTMTHSYLTLCLVLRIAPGRWRGATAAYFLREALSGLQFAAS